jgi:hypothetical protein
MMLADSEGNSAQRPFPRIRGFVERLVQDPADPFVAGLFESALPGAFDQSRATGPHPSSE